jgi:GH24 family phage-related lysozyme (muramidase)
MLEKLNNVYIGLVVNNKDPKGRGRVQVFIPNITNTLYKNWNENTKDIKFRTLDSDIFNPEITQRLIDVLPWSEVTMPFFGGGTGAPVNTQTNEPTPVPTDPIVSSPGEYMVFSGSSSSSSSPNYVDNVLKGSNGGTTRLDIPSSGTADSRFLNQEFARRLNGLYKDLSDAGYNVTLNSGFRAPTEAIKKQLGSSGSSQEVLFAQNPNPKAVAPPGKSKHDSGIAADLTVVGNGKYGNVNIHTISVANNDKNTVTPEYFSLLAKHGLQRPMSWENWHLEPVETQGRSKEEAAALLTTNYNAKPNLDNATPTTASQTGSMPTQNGINNTRGEVSNDTQSINTGSSFYSNNLLSFIKDKEGYSATAYKDGSQYSIGYGTVAKNPTETIDKTEAELRLKKEIDQSAILTNKELNSRGIVNLTQSQKEALYSYTYNRGLGGTKELLNNSSPSWDSISSNMPKYWGSNQSAKNGLINRRNAEVYYANTNGQGGYLPDNSNKDPQKLNMICSSFNNNNVGSGMSSIGSAGGPIGMFSIPQVGAKAYIMFLDGNPLQPIVLGSFQDPSNVG